MISSGSSFSDIARELEAQRFVRADYVPKAIAKLKGFDTRTIKAGEYTMTRGMRPSSIVAKLISGETVKRRVTITEGMTLRDISRLVAAAGVLKEDEFWKMVHDPTLIRKWGLSGDSFEGYLFPETYFFSLPVKPEEVLGTFIKEGERYWPESYTVQAEKLGFNRHQVLTLASIIEKETGDVAEQPYVSSVFHNRLARDMKLQADPTVIYGIPNFNGNLTKQDLQTPTPYNTYTNLGLPPGPIGSPGKSAIHAALFPLETQFLYFVADGTGKHTFSTELGEHNKAVNALVELSKSNGGDPSPTPKTPPISAPSLLRPTPKSPMIKMGGFPR